MQSDDHARANGQAPAELSAVSIDKPGAKPDEGSRAHETENDFADPVHAVLAKGGAGSSTGSRARPCVRAARRRGAQVNPDKRREALAQQNRETVHAAAADALRRVIDELFDKGRLVTNVNINIDSVVNTAAAPIIPVETRRA